MKTTYIATYYDKDGDWQDQYNDAGNEQEAINAGQGYLNGAKDGSYVEIAKVDKIKRLERGAVKVKAL